MSPGSILAARRELRGGFKKFRVLVACLAMGVAAIAAVQSVANSIFQGLQQDGRAILGGDIALRSNYQEITTAQFDFIRDTSLDQTRFVETRTMARNANGDDSVLVELKAVDSAYPLFGEVDVRVGTDTRKVSRVALVQLLGERDGDLGVLIDAGLEQRLQLKENDSIFIGGENFEVRGIIVKEPDRAGSGNTFGFWPRVMVPVDALSGSSLLQTGSMIYHHYRLRLADDQDPVAYRERLSATFPDAHWRLRDFRNAAPRLKEVVERVTMFLTLVGLTTLLVGGVGVSNAVRNYLEQKHNTIATFKCLGASNRFIFETYLIQVLVIASVGILLGAMLGASVAPTAGLMLESVLPVSLRFGDLFRAVILSMAFGFLITLIFTVWPLANTRDVKAGALFRHGLDEQASRPRFVYVVFTLVCVLALTALTLTIASHKPFALWFIGASIVSLVVFSFAGKLVKFVAGKIKSPKHPGLRLALSNLHRPGAVTTSIILSLGLGLTVLVAIALVENNFSRHINDSLPDQAPSFFFIDIQSHQIDAFSDSATKFDGAGHLMKVPFLRGRIVDINGTDPEQALVDPEEAWMIRGDRGITFASRPPENTKVIEGEWWEEDYKGPPLVSTHKDFMRAFNLKLGDTVTVNILGREITATIASVRDLEWQSMQLNFLMVLSPEPLRSAPHGYLATLEADTDSELDISRAVTKQFPNVTIITVREALNRINEMMSKVGYAVRAIAAVSVIAGILVLTGAIVSGHSRRVYESVVLKVFGAKRGDIIKAFSLEYAMLGFLAAIIAAVVGTIVSWAVMVFVMRYDWQFSPVVVIAVIVTCTLITLGVGLLSTWKTLGQKALPYLRNE